MLILGGLALIGLVAAIAGLGFLLWLYITYGRS